MNFDLHPDIDQPLALQSITDPIDEPNIFKLSISRLCDGLKVIANATLATSLSLIYIYSVNLISLAYIGLLKNPAMLGGIGLGFACSNSCAYVLISSINQGVNVLSAQAFGAKKDRLVALSYHRGLFLLAIILVPILILLGFARQVLVFFGIQDDVAQFAWEYIMSAFPSYFFFSIFDCTKSYLYAQNIFKPILYTQTITTALHFFWSWLFIIKLDLGPAGAGIAKNIFELSNMIIILMYIYLSKCCQSNWVPFIQIQWRHEVLQWDGMKLFLTTIVPIAALMFLDMACYEIFTVFAGQFDERQLSVHVALANTITIYYSMPFGLSIAVMTYVANAMGRGLPNMAKNYTYLGLMLNICVTGAFMILLLILKEEWATLFSSSQEIKDLLLEILNIYFIFTLFDGIQVVLSGTLKGIGKQNAATIGLFISYYIITLPLIYCLAFRLEMGVKGIWYGFLCGIFVLFITYIAVLGTSSFKAQAKKIQESLVPR